jgi:hypothetical protein
MHYTPLIVAGETECDRTKDKSPTPGCDRRYQIPSIAFQLHQIHQAESDPTVKQKLRDAIAALGEVLSSITH